MKIKFISFIMVIGCVFLIIGCSKIDNNIDSVNKLVLNETILTIDEGDYYRLILEGNPENAEWNSSNLMVATVENGFISALSPGIATITVKLRDLATSCVITVTENLNPRIKIDLNILNMKAGEKNQLQAEPVFAEGNITWTSSNNSIAMVDNDGNITAYRAGSARISASIGDIIGYCTVKVQNPVENLDVLDFYISVEAGRDIRVLQLTDTQIIDSSQMRRPDRLGAGSIAAWAPEKLYDNCFKYINDSIERTNPDFIFISGDIVYGEFDDFGTSLTSLINYMDSFKIPWGLTFGNHENESRKGVEWQVKQLTDSPYCLFKRGKVTGNSNYTVGILQNGALTRAIYFIDSNGCSNPAFSNEVKKTNGIEYDQVQWLNSVGTSVENVLGKKVPSIAVWHILSNEFKEALDTKYPYPYPRTTENLFEIGVDFDAKDGDFGSMREGLKGIYTSPGLYDALKTCGVDGVFVGHNHEINTSILYNDIRWTFGLKTGTYDRSPGKLGGTSITFKSENAPMVKHVYFGEDN